MSSTTEDLDFEALQEEIVQALQAEDESVLADRLSPLTVFPLVKRPLFPGMATPLMIEKGPYYEALKALSQSKQRLVALVLTKKEDVSLKKLKKEDLHNFGVIARILRIIPSSGGHAAQVVVTVDQRLQINEWDSAGELITAQGVPLDEPKTSSDRLKAYSISIVSAIKELLKLNPLFKEELQIFLSHSDFTESAKLADFAASLTTASRDELQDILETVDIEQRVEKVLILLRKEIDLGQMQSDIHKKVESSFTKNQREFFLKEQLKTIKKELGLEGVRGHDLSKYETRLKERVVPESIAKTIQEELEILGSLEPTSSEYAVRSSYVDWLTVMPWGKTTEDNFDLVHAKKVLEEDHYGLSDVKERILEFMSVGKLSGGVKGSILCLVGPPGVGKTSIAKSVAKALGRKFFRFSVGGMRDEAEIKGHRRTYVGAMPGKLIQAMKLTQSMNPVVLIDEIDKMGSSFQGDPGSALLEVLDPEQNREFLDHYLDVPVDLSKVLFVTTANMTDSIPEPLKDRMEVIRLSGYLEEEKVVIATRFLIAKHLKEAGIQQTQLKIEKEAVKEIVRSWARESGLRGLENAIKRIVRKAAVKIVSGEETVTIKVEELSKWLGLPPFTSDRLYPKLPIGVTCGLAWTSMGGSTIYVEAMATAAEKNGLHMTGQAGSVMKESSEIAWSYVSSQFKQFAPKSQFFEKQSIHIHLPEGAVPKDGPSAGVTMVTALLSLLMKKAPLSSVAMTGEMTLTGKVLPVGGIKEKLMAAKRAGLQRIILPKENERDVQELPAAVKKGLKFHFVSDYRDVFSIVF